MGAIEYIPATGPQLTIDSQLHVDRLVELASDILTHQDSLQTHFTEEKGDAMTDILRVGTSAGGARAKAVIAWNPQTNEVRSGQTEVADDFEYWLIKFDGVSNNRDK